MSDTAIRASLRSVLHRNHIDVSSLQCGAFRGVVRLGGSVLTTFTRSQPTPEVLDAFEHQVRAIRGVIRVDLRFDNVCKDLEGNWKPVAPTVESDQSAA